MKFIAIFSLMLLTGCTYFLAHPKLVEDVIEDEVKAVEDIAKDS
jgi:hypothetical protein